MTTEKFLCNIFRAVSQQRDAKKIFLLRKIDGVVEQLRSVALRLVFFMDDQVLEQHDKAAFGRADGEEQIDHAHDRAVASQHENAPAAGLFENERQTETLRVLVRTKLA